MRKIHFVSLFNPEYDFDMLKPWATYFRSLNLDTYTIYMHTRSNPSSEKVDSWRREFTKYGFFAEYIQDEARCAFIRERVMGEHIRYLDSDDYIMTIDSDEIPELPENFKEIVFSSAMVTGSLIDRWGSELCDYDGTRTLDLTYPFRGNFYSHANIERKDIEGPLNKIIVSRVSVPISFAGSHVHFAEEPDASNIAGPYVINHFRYRGSLKQRMIERGVYSAEDIIEINTYFKRCQVCSQKQ